MIGCQLKEIIIIDDGSKDSSVQVITGFIKNHDKNKIIKFYKQENCGVVKTLNRLIDMTYERSDLDFQDRKSVV